MTEQVRKPSLRRRVGARVTQRFLGGAEIRTRPNMGEFHWRGRHTSAKSELSPHHPLSPQLAPEHTLMSFRKALEQKLYGLQADVTIR